MYCFAGNLPYSAQALIIPTEKRRKSSHNINLYVPEVWSFPSFHFILPSTELMSQLTILDSTMSLTARVTLKLTK